MTRNRPRKSNTLRLESIDGLTGPRLVPIATTPGSSLAVSASCGGCTSCPGTVLIVSALASSQKSSMNRH